MASQSSHNLSLLQYARYHCLSRPCEPEETDVHADLPLPIDSHLSFPSDELSHGKDLQPERLSKPEKLSLNQEERCLLASILKASEDLLGDEYDEGDESGKISTRKLKLELPLLRTDHDLEFRCFLRRRTAAKQTFDDIQYEPTRTDEEEGDGFRWSKQSMGLPAKYEKLCEGEKLAIDRDAMIWLHHALNFDAEHHHEAKEEGQMEQGMKLRNVVLARLTPPLSPVSDFHGRFESSPVNECFSLLPDHTSPTVQISKSLDESLAQQDSFFADALSDRLNDYQESSGDLEDPYVGHAAECKGLVPYSPFRTRIANLKVDEVLTPPYSTAMPTSVPRSDDLSQLAVSLPFPEPETTSGSQEDFDAFFNEVIETEACKVTMELENEQLQQADATMRVEVPVLDCFVPKPPWKLPLSEEDEERETRELMLPIALMKMHHLPATKTDQELRWVPFPMIAEKQTAEEQIDQNDLVQQFVELLDLGPHIDPEALCWKPDGLRILGEGDFGEDEVRGSTFDSEVDFEGLLRKRKTELGLACLEESSSGTEPRRYAAGVVKKPYGDTAISYDKQGDRQKANSLGPMSAAISFGETFSVSDELSRFLEIQTGQISKKRKTVHIPTASALPTDDGLSLSLQNGKFSTPKMSITKPTLVPEEPETHPMTTLRPEEIISVSAQAIVDSKQARPIIISSALLSEQRQLVKAILSAQPNLQLISRDFTTWCTVANSHLQQSNQPSQPATEHEADIILSPGTGIILTTPQKAKQKSLPGQGDLSALRTRILTVCPRYEHLYILVCAGSTNTNRCLPATLQPLQRAHLLHSSFATGAAQTAHDNHSSANLLPTTPTMDETPQPADLEAIASLTSFCATLAPIADVSVVFIPSTPPTPPAAQAQQQQPWPHAAAHWISNLILASPLPELASNNASAATTATTTYAQGSDDTPGDDNAGGDDDDDDDDDDDQAQCRWSLLQDETTWELMLRKAGMNAFAAQAVLLALRERPSPPPPPIESDDDIPFTTSLAGTRSEEDGDEGGRGWRSAGARYGLPGFVLMTAAERRARFAALMGGTRVLDRAGRLFDNSWGHG